MTQRQRQQSMMQTPPSSMDAKRFECLDAADYDNDDTSTAKADKPAEYIMLLVITLVFVIATGCIVGFIHRYHDLQRQQRSISGRVDFQSQILRACED